MNKNHSVVVEIKIADDGPPSVEHVPGTEPGEAVALLLDRIADSTQRDLHAAAAIESYQSSLPGYIAGCQQAPDSGGRPVANLLTITALVAYRRGDGVLAGAAIRRALRIEPHHVLARLAQGMLREGVPPEDLDKLAEGIREVVIERQRR